VGQDGIRRPPDFLARLRIPESVLRHTLTALSYGAGREMLCYWIGTELKDVSEPSAVVLTVALPRIESSYAQFRLVEGQMGQITSWCASHGLWVLAQVHTHPTDEPHSEADECWPASHRHGFLSVVLPYFANMSSLLNPGWRVYESQGAGVWTEVVAEKKLEIVQDIWLPGSSQ